MTDKILQEIADRAEAARLFPTHGQSREQLDAITDLICQDIPLLLSELQKARERVEVLETALKPFAVKDLGRQTYGDFDRARQALSPAPVGVSPTSGGGDE